MGHGLAFAFQGIIFLLLLDAARDFPLAMALLGAFALAGGALAYLWYRWTSIPHALDMCVGMLRSATLACCSAGGPTTASPRSAMAIAATASMQCVSGVMKPWMWIGMLAFANGAMIWLQRRPVVRRRDHTLAMFTGGNIGMVLGHARGRVVCGTDRDHDHGSGRVHEFRGHDGRHARRNAARDVADGKIDRNGVDVSLDPAWLRAGGITSTAG